MAELGELGIQREYIGGSYFTDEKTYVVSFEYWNTLGQDATHNIEGLRAPLNRIIMGQDIGNQTVARGFAEDGIITGTITENGTPIENVTVALMWRNPPKLLMTITTNASGNYTFTGLDAGKLNAYSIIMMDKSGGTVYNDMIKSQVTPFGMGTTTRWQLPDTHSQITLSNNNLRAAGSVGWSGTAISHIAKNFGKKYYEIEIFTDSSPGTGLHNVGIASTLSTVPNGSYAGQSSNSWGWQCTHSTAKRWNSASSNNYGTTAVATDVVGILMDMDNWTLSFTLNGVSQGTAFSGLSSAYSYYPLLSLYDTGAVVDAIFAKASWNYTPAGYDAW